MVQTWHGTPLKKIGLDIATKRFGAASPLEKISFEYLHDAEQYDYFLSPSRFASEKFTTSFGLDQLAKESVILEEGYPRNDFLKNHLQADVKRIKESLLIPSGKKVILYAPTWRDDQHLAGKGYQFKPFIDFDVMKEQFGTEYIVLYRTHYLISNVFDDSRYNGFVKNVSRLDDVNELYVVSDLLITDYSSVFFDYANLKRPIIFFMPDFENYKNNLRDFYLTIDQLPGPVIKQEEELFAWIRQLSANPRIATERLDTFNTIFNYLDDGEVSKRVIRKIFKQ